MPDKQTHNQTQTPDSCLFYEILSEKSSLCFCRAEHCVFQAHRPPHPESGVRQFFAGKGVFITGGSGLVGKVLIEKILRDCPDVGRTYLHTLILHLLQHTLLQHATTRYNTLQQPVKDLTGVPRCRTYVSLQLFLAKLSIFRDYSRKKFIGVNT